MLEIPGTPWRDLPWIGEEALPHAPLPGLAWQALPVEALHGFTHFELRLRLFRATFAGQAPEGLAWMTQDAAAAAMPSVMRKLLALLGDASTG